MIYRAEPDTGIALDRGAVIGLFPIGIAAIDRQFQLVIGAHCAIDIVTGEIVGRWRLRPGIWLLHRRRAAIHGAAQRHRSGRRCHHRGRAAARHHAQREAVTFIARQECHGTRGADHAAVVIGIGHRNPVGHGGGHAVEGRTVHAIGEVQRQCILGGIGMHAFEGHVVKPNLQRTRVMGGDFEPGGSLRRRGRGSQHQADERRGEGRRNGHVPGHDDLPLACAKQQPRASLTEVNFSLTAAFMDMANAAPSPCRPLR